MIDSLNLWFPTDTNHDAMPAARFEIGAAIQATQLPVIEFSRGDLPYWMDIEPSTMIC